MQDHDWLFDLTMNLCDRAEQLGLNAMSAKLEEALDAYLVETGHAAKPVQVSDVPVAAFGPISLRQDSFVLGSRNAPRNAAVPFASRRGTPSLALQALQAARARTGQDDSGEDEPMELLNRAS